MENFLSSRQGCNIPCRACRCLSAKLGLQHFGDITNSGKITNFILTTRTKSLRRRGPGCTYSWVPASTTHARNLAPPSTSCLMWFHYHPASHLFRLNKCRVGRGGFRSHICDFITDYLWKMLQTPSQSTLSLITLIHGRDFSYHLTPNSVIYL